ncbi:S41 family peptidase [Marinilabilia salmonicolor]|uniref:S41 family peptidase n=2 Tax=Marinilabilia salmonicolor TaxID=989 RepID=UPI00029A984B|nr:S41 family peptidase [Marinilabilia salmonicolor]
MKIFLFEVVICFLFLSCSSNVFVREQYISYEEKQDTVLTGERIDLFINRIKKYHPYSFDSLGGRGIDELIEKIGKSFPTQKMNDAELVFQARKLMDFINHEDPHFRIIPVFRKFPELKYKTASITVPPFRGLCINDSLLVYSPYDEGLKRGDLIKSINDIPVKEYLHYYYRDRYVDVGNLVWYFNYRVYPRYKIDFIRNDEENSVIIEGMPYPNYLVKGGPFCEGKIIPGYSLGYFKIREFENNRYILKKFRKLVDEMTEKGYSDLIIDLRENTGGSGNDLNLFFSFFSDKDSLHYLKNAKARVSKITKDYGFDESQYGQVLSLPSEKVFHSFALDSSLFVPNLKVYVLISRTTGSIAASFANICQYNGIGTLVGEQLAPNALKYGEVASGEFLDNPFAFSTIQYDEYTKAKDGIVRPDIPIPYIAREYMKGGDPVLEKLLEYLKDEKLVFFQ